MMRMLTLGMLLAIAGPAAAQQAYPNKFIRMIVPFPPGGANTILARMLGQKLTESWGQQVVVDNRGGGNTIIGSEALVKSPPDGYTLILVSSAHVINPLLLPNLPYDAIKDFAPVASIASTEQLLVIHPSVPANNLQEFIALAKSKPGQLNYASSGTGGVQHLAGEYFNMMAGVKIQHIPYKGGGPAITDLIGGQVQVYFAATSVAIPLINTGKIKALAISGESRLPALPQVPTFDEAGLPGYEGKGWFAVLAPAGTPKNIIDKLSTEIGRIVAIPDIKEKLVSLGVAPFICTPDQLAALMKTDMARFAGIIKTADIKIEQ
jgi:tripartite-type tricarboxylate transporter receptor subunit TctC